MAAKRTLAVNATMRSTQSSSASKPAAPKTVATISERGAQPVGMTLSADQSHHFSLPTRTSDTISIVDTGTDKLHGDGAGSPPDRARGVRGATPVSIALSPDQKTMYAALADMNAIAVVSIVNIHSPVLLGYLPTGWYPSAVIKADRDGKRLLVADAKELPRQ